MKVVHLSSVHPWDDVRILRKEAASAAQRGYRVTVIARAARAVASPPTGVEVIVLPDPVSRAHRVWRLGWELFRYCRAQRADLYQFHDPELIGLGLCLRLLGKRVVYDVHEDLPRQLKAKYWIPPWLRGFLSLLVQQVEELAARALTGVIAATPTIAARFPPNRCVVVRNYPLLAATDHRSPAYIHRDPVLAYVGGITEHRGAFTMLDGLALVREQHPACRLALSGRVDDPAIMARMRTHPAWPGVEWLGWLPHAEVMAQLERARIGLVVLQPLVNYLDSLPIKLFEYMSAGLPVIASNFPLWRAIIDRHRCGLVVDPASPPDIARAIQWLLDHPADAEAMGRRGWLAVREHHNWEAEAEVLVAQYARLLGASPDRAAPGEPASAPHRA